MAKAWLGGVTNYGVILWDANEALAGYDLRFYSTESAPSMLDQPYLEIDWTINTRTVYYLKDHLGSVRATVNDVGEVVSYDDYDAWGLILNGRSMTAQANLPNKFTGKEWDDDFGLNWNYFGARYYDPVIGRWLSVDPVAEKFPSLSPYNYAKNNPIKFVDPDGKAPIIRTGNIGVAFDKFLSVRNSTINSLNQRAEAGGVLGAAAGALSTAIEFLTPGSLAEQMNSGAFGLLGAASKADEIVQFGQKSISQFFSKKGDFAGTPVKSIAEKLKSGALSAQDVKVDFVLINGQRVAVNNRSLAALSQAGLTPTNVVDKTSDPKVLKKVQERLKQMGGKPSETIKVRDEQKTLIQIVKEE